MKTKHTPGPWLAQGQENVASGKREWVIKTPEVDCVSRVIATTPYSKKYNDHEANARLIAAAPELLEACQLASAAIKSYQMRLPKSAIWEQDNKDLEIIKKAIAKAEGK